ncbi:STAS domain-containing protein [Leptospira sp. GIMC2001]|uniref:STAS domain-containing protein n=1 Tax=Leptospira sp. GIMC2001 TaxID=1513297 RepID=UPI00234B548C|nr:STAS domain-containing protein [Leptospira sp. GIMC2001]WCL48798.1 STAS domain-containing protein [Leptospira sp. GIMC2001]
MEIDLKKTGNTVIINISGSLDIYTSLDFKTFLEANVKEGDSNLHVLVNLEKLNYIDSSGIGMLIKQLNYVQELKGKFSIANMKPAIEKVFKVAGLTSYFHTIGEEEFKAQYSS